MSATTGLPVAQALVLMALAPAELFGQTATVTGRVETPGLSEVLFNGSPPAISDGWSVGADPNDLPVEVRGDGSFMVTLPAAEARFYRLSAGARTLDLLVSPGSSGRITVPAAVSEPVVFEGDHAVENRYLVELGGRLSASERMLNTTFRSLFVLDPDAFTERVATMEKPVRSAHSAFVARHPDLPGLFLRRARGDIDSWFALVGLIYPSLFHQLTGKPAAVEASYYDEIARPLLQRPELLSSQRYVTFLDEYLARASAGPLRFADANLPSEKLHSRYEAIRGLAAPQQTREYLLRQMFSTFETNYGARDWGPVLERLEQDRPGHPVVVEVRPVLAREMAERERPTAIRVFKEVDGAALEAHLFLPEGHGEKRGHSAYLFFHGGGWAIGTPEWGYASCERMADRGMVAISFEYRLADVHGAKLFTAVEDVQSAVAWVRQQAEELRIDPDKVVAAGFSAGGHLAGVAAMLDADQGPTSTRPNAIVLHSSSYDLTKGRFFQAMTDGRAEAFSLQHQVGPDLVPALLLHGTEDHLAPIAELRAFVSRMEDLENDFEHHIFEGVGHFFRNEEARARVIQVTDDFLARHGFLPGPSGRP